MLRVCGTVPNALCVPVVHLSGPAWAGCRPPGAAVTGHIAQCMSCVRSRVFKQGKVFKVAWLLLMSILINPYDSSRNFERFLAPTMPYMIVLRILTV